MSTITLKNKVKIIDNNLVQKSQNKNIHNTYNYLQSRSFDYFPEIIKEDEEYIYYKYLNDIEEPKEQKITDLINLITLLHNKTTFYKEIDLDYYKKIYEDITNDINNLYIYYEELLDKIESQTYMSPSNYLIARNTSIIYSSLAYSKNNLNEWYNSIENKRKIRLVTTHNNLKLDHYLKDDKPYLISWDKTRIDMPIFDLISLYQNNYLEYEFPDLINLYLSKYPLQKEEIKLFLIIISIPGKITEEDNEYNRVVSIRKQFDYLYKSKELVSIFDKDLDQKQNTV